MKELTKTIVRSVTLRASDPGLEDAQWVLRLQPEGVVVRRRGAPKETGRKISWRAVIGTALVFNKAGE